MAEQKTDSTLPTIPGMPGQTPISIPTKEAEKPTANRFTSALAMEARSRGKDIKNMDYWAGVQERANKPINPLQAALMGALKALPTLMATSKYNNPLVSGIAGLSSGVQNVGDMQQAQKEQVINDLDNSLVSERFPDFVAQNPSVKDMTVGEFKKIGPIIAAFEKKSALKDLLGEEDIPAMEEILARKGFDDVAEKKRVIQAFMGQSWGDFKALQPKTRIARAQRTQEVAPDEFGIPTGFYEEDAVSGGLTMKPVGSNVRVSQNLAAIGKGKQILDELYTHISHLSPETRQGLAAEARIGGNILKFLGKAGIGGEEGEKVKQIKNVIDANIPLIARSLGHTGVLTELDVLKSFGVMPDVDLNTTELVYRKGLVDDMIAANVRNTVKGTIKVLGQGVNYQMLADSMGLPVDMLKDGKTKPSVSTKDPANRYAELRASGKTEDETYAIMARE